MIPTGSLLLPAQSHGFSGLAAAQHISYCPHTFDCSVSSDIRCAFLVGSTFVFLTFYFEVIHRNCKDSTEGPMDSPANFLNLTSYLLQYQNQESDVGTIHGLSHTRVCSMQRIFMKKSVNSIS